MAIDLKAMEGMAYTVEDMAESSGAITYEVLTAINTRVPRVYHGAGAPGDE